MTILNPPQAEVGAEDLILGMFRELGQILWLLSPDGAVLQFNQAWNQYTGLSPDVSGFSWAEVFHPDDRARLLEARIAGIASGEPYEVEARMRRHDGQYRRHLCRVKPLVRQGSVQGWLGTAMDVEDYRLVQDRRMQADARQLALLQLGAALRGATDPDEMIRGGLETVGRVLGAVRVGYAAVDLDDGVADVVADWVQTPDLRSAVGAYRIADWGHYLTPLMAGETVAITDLLVDPRTVDSAEGWASWHLRAAAFLPLMKGDDLVAYMFVHSDQVRAWDAGDLDFVRTVADRLWVALDAAAVVGSVRNLLAAVLEASPDPIFAKSPAGVYLVANPAAAAALGCQGRDIVGFRDEELIPAELLASVRAHDALVLAGDTLTEEEVVSATAEVPATYLVTKAPMRDPTGAVTGLVAVARDISERKAQDRHRELLVNELNHRVKNTLALVQGLARQSLRQFPASAVVAFEGRLIATAAAHDVLTRHNWELAFIDEIVQAAMRPFQDAERPERIRFNGPRLRLQSKHAVALTLALHELATNATKYGALSVEAGRVTVHWWLTPTEQGPEMRLVWSEQGGPEVPSQPKQGFGSRLIERGVAQDLQGHAQITYRPSGVICEIRALLLYTTPAGAPPT